MPHEIPLIRDASPALRIMRRVQRTDDGCWISSLGVIPAGYSTVQQGGAGSPFLRSHRVIYELFVGPIPDGLDLDHLCRNRACVNPDHLEPVTRGENVRRGDSAPAIAVRTNTCQRGHVDKWVSNGPGRRCCGECRKMNKQQRENCDAS